MTLLPTLSKTWQRKKQNASEKDRGKPRSRGNRAGYLSDDNVLRPLILIPGVRGLKGILIAGLVRRVCPGRYKLGKRLEQGREGGG